MLKLLLKFHEDRMRNLDLRITWIQDKGSFRVGNTNYNFDKDPSNGWIVFGYLANRALALQIRGLGLVGQMGI